MCLRSCKIAAVTLGLFVLFVNGAVIPELDSNPSNIRDERCEMPCADGLVCDKYLGCVYIESAHAEKQTTQTRGNLALYVVGAIISIVTLLLCCSCCCRQCRRTSCCICIDAGDADSTENCCGADDPNDNCCGADDADNNCCAADDTDNNCCAAADDPGTDGCCGTNDDCVSCGSD